jgi:hypothetical protein
LRTADFVPVRSPNSGGASPVVWFARRIFAIFSAATPRPPGRWRSSASRPFAEKVRFQPGLEPSYGFAPRGRVHFRPAIPGEQLLDLARISGRKSIEIPQIAHHACRKRQRLRPTPPIASASAGNNFARRGCSSPMCLSIGH